MDRKKHLFVNSWELATAVDGPGTRLVIFLQGCKLRCQFCHNPETWTIPTSDRSEDISSSVMDISQITALMTRYKHIFDATSGGITFSGGEALLQKDAVFEVLKFAKQEHIHTCLDTAGYGASSISDEFLELVDLVLLDIKAPSPEKYLEITRVDIFDEVINFASRLKAMQINFRWRFVLVPGLTDGESFLNGIKNVVSKFDVPIDVLPFHQMAISKYDDLNINYSLKGYRSATQEDVILTKPFFN